MQSTPVSVGSTEMDCLRRVREVCPETNLPGYWANLSDNCSQWARHVGADKFWTEAKTRLSQWRTEYQAATGAALLRASDFPEFVGKSEASIRDKLFRQWKKDPEVINQMASASPSLPPIKDLVRTRVVCTFIDGVEFLTSKIAELAQEMNCLVDRNREGRLEGYFAQHLNIHHSVIYRLGGADRLASIVCEIQVASEMATRMWDVGHALYERIRGEATIPDNWQWDAHDPRFIPHQLGHMIHLADGLMVLIRESGKQEK